MATQKASPAERPSGEELRRRIAPLLDPAVSASIERLRRRLARDLKDVPSIDEVRELLDKALGSRKTTDLLDEVRGKY